MKIIPPQNLFNKLITMSKTIYFLNKKYTCSENGEISTHHFRNRKPIGVVLLGRKRMPVFLCLCGCRIYNCDDRLFTIRIDEEEIDGRVLKYSFVNHRQYNLFKRFEEIDAFYGCTKTFEQLK